MMPRLTAALNWPVCARLASTLSRALAAKLKGRLSP